MSLKKFTADVMQQFRASAFNTVVRWRKLTDVENECTSRKPILCAIRVPKIIKFGTYLTNLWQKNCTVFFETWCMDQR